MEIDTPTKAAIIGAAHAAAQTEELDDGMDFDSMVAIKAAEITSQMTGESPVVKAIEQVAASKVFAATVLNIKKEQSSTRGVLTLKTKPSQYNEDGKETARTERTDNPVGLAMARKVQNLVGHRVLVHIEVETYNEGSGKVRVLRHITDLGVDKSE